MVRISAAYMRDAHAGAWVLDTPGVSRSSASASAKPTLIFWVR